MQPQNPIISNSFLVSDNMSLQDRKYAVFDVKCIAYARIIVILVLILYKFNVKTAVQPFIQLNRLRVPLHRAAAMDRLKLHRIAVHLTNECERWNLF